MTAAGEDVPRSRPPKVSVLLAVNNGEEFIEEAVRSVIAQAYKHWELIVVSNGSTDSTVALCQELAATDPRVRVYAVANKNKNAAYNLAFARSQGDYVCFFAADDTLPPHSLEQRLAVLAGEGSEVFSTCCLQTFSDDPKYDGLVYPRNRSRPNLSGGSLLFSRRLAELVFPLPEDQPNEDTWTQLHLRAFGRNRHVPQPLYKYRIHGGNSYGYGMSFDEKRSQYLRRMHAYQLFYDKYRDSQLPFVQSVVIPFLAGLRAANNGSLGSIFRVKDLAFGSKMVLALYSSPIMYRIRHTYFRALTGGVAR